MQWLVGQLDFSGVPFVGSMLNVITSLPVTLSMGLALVTSAVGLWWGWRTAFNEVMVQIYILDGEKRVIKCHYPNSHMVGRGDQLESGEFVLALPSCCPPKRSRRKSSTKTVTSVDGTPSLVSVHEKMEERECPHPYRKLYERDLELALPSASSVGIINASTKYVYAKRAQMAGRQCPPVQVDDKNEVMKSLPYGIVSLVLGGGAFLLLTMDPGETDTYTPPVVAETTIDGLEGVAIPLEDLEATIVAEDALAAAAESAAESSEVVDDVVVDESASQDPVDP